ncbi:MAG TPA: hypothetical protein VK453_24500 [Micromonosporaceae bacterium]|nr:hypothetical protein [Micromonosporaceae bacterium]
MITIPTADLTGVLADVLPFASTDKDLPDLNCVFLRWDGQQLHATATDRQRIAIASWHPDDDTWGLVGDVQDDLLSEFGGAEYAWQAVLDLADTTQLVKVFKLPAKAGRTPVTVDVDQARGRVTVSRSRDTGYSALRATVDSQTVIFPDVRSAMTEAGAAVLKTDRVGHSAKALADFGKVRPQGPLVMTFTPTMTLVAIGERFAGAIVPAKLG